MRLPSVTFKRLIATETVIYSELWPPKLRFYRETLWRKEKYTFSSAALLHFSPKVVPQLHVLSYT